MMDEAQSAQTANAYDVLPYRDLPYGFTHPRHLESMATLFGMQPPPLDHCRVLEVGCAGGGNIIPMATDLSESEFLGVDYSQRQVDQANESRAALGIQNLTFRQANILDIDSSWGKFDYIVAHGVFSWVPPEVQEHLLRVLSENLSPNGVSFVSYNTYPGWHLAQIARDAMRYHAAQFDAPQQKVNQAKAILALMARASNGNRASGKVFQEELEVVEKANNDSYLFHEHLEADNSPIYFHDFMQRAAAVGLQYLSEAEFMTMLLRNTSRELQEPLAALPLIAQEQFMDFARGRRFRATLLCHAEIALDRTLTPEKIKPFSIYMGDNVESANVNIHNDVPAEFRLNDNSMRTGDRVTKAAMIYLKETSPRPIPFRELLLTALARTAGGRPQTATAVAADTLAADILNAFSINLVRICLHAPTFATRISERPEASPLARWQAANGDHVTNRHHGVVPVDGLIRRLLLRLDGSHSRSDLLATVRQGCEAGEATIRSASGPVSALDPKITAQVLDQCLSRIASSALLVG